MGTKREKEEVSLVLPKCYIGVEIEIERAATLTLKAPQWWSVKGDGSLRDGGLELVFKKPLFGKDAISALEEAFFTLLTPKMQISPRTSIHVHVNAKDMNIKELHNLCVLYALVEEPLFKWVGDYRDLNQFCLPWFEADGDIEKISQMVTSKDLNVLERASKLHRYSALNLNAIHKFHSIEFRHLKTTLDFKRVVTWINLVLCLKREAVEHQGSAYSLLARYTDLGKSKFVKNVFVEYASELDPQCINLGPTVAQELCQASVAGVGVGPLFYAHQFPKGTPDGYKDFYERKL